MMTETDANAMAAEKNYELWKQEETRREAAEADLMVAEEKLRKVTSLVGKAAFLEMHQLRNLLAIIRDTVNS